MSKLFNEIQEGNNPIIVYGAGIIAKAVVITLKAILKDPTRILCCAVTNINHNAKTIEEIEVREISNLVDYKETAVVIVATKKMYQKEIIKLLDELKFENVMDVSKQECINVLQDIWKTKYPKHYEMYNEHNFSSELNDEEYITFLSRQLNEKINFEVNLADHCNLNCQSCNHFSPIASNNFLDVEQYRKDAKRVKQITENKIGTIMLLGGEPLLHENIEEICVITREAFCDAEISIVSNGLLLPKMKDSFWECCKQNNIGILLTKYQVKFDYEKWKLYAQEKGVRLTFTLDSVECKTTYKLPIDLEGKQNEYAMYAKCYHANKCVVLKNGRFYTCPFAAYVNYFNSFFDENLPEEEQNSIGINEVNSLKELEDYLKMPVPMCRHCDICGYKYDIPWAVSKRAKSEWT